MPGDAFGVAVNFAGGLLYGLPENEKDSLWLSS